jgi:NOL1/NOP2/sun family putative RNA methylase
MIPSFLIEKLKNQYGEELTNKILEGYNQKRKVTLRVNTIKANINEIQKILDNSNIVYTKVPWSDDALIIENVREPEITKLTIYDEGKIYLQSLSSMLPPIILQPKENDDILDMAAAPGGKTTQIASIVNNKARITACEMNNIRAEKLKYNIEKQGANCVYVMVTDSRKIDDFFSFDSILLDAPCSGSGTLNNNDNKIEKTFTPELIQKSSKTQAQLLKKAINILKQGKEMIYSTCSILQEENEDILASILKTGKVEIVPINVDKTIPKLPTKIDGTLCVCPNEEYEGFFVAKIRKIAR